MESLRSVDQSPDQILYHQWDGGKAAFMFSYVLEQIPSKLWLPWQQKAPTDL